MYGTFLYPRSTRRGPWVLQTDDRALIAIMQERSAQRSSPWRRVLSGTSYGYMRHFNNSRNAMDSVARILKKFAADEPEFKDLSDGIGWVIKTNPRPNDVPNLCAYAGKKSKHDLNRAA